MKTTKDYTSTLIKQVKNYEPDFQDENAIAYAISCIENRLSGNLRRDVQEVLDTLYLCGC